MCMLAVPSCKHAVTCCAAHLPHQPLASSLRSCSCRHLRALAPMQALKADILGTHAHTQMPDDHTNEASTSEIWLSKGHGFGMVRCEPAPGVSTTLYVMTHGRR
jgi:hypothetical protein